MTVWGKTDVGERRRMIIRKTAPGINADGEKKISEYLDYWDLKSKTILMNILGKRILGTLMTTEDGCLRG